MTSKSNVQASPKQPGFKRRWLILTAAIILGTALAVVWFTPSLFVPIALRIAYAWDGAHASEIQVGGRAWPYLAAGDPAAPPIILLHGFGSSREAMMSLMPWLDQKHYCVAPDLPGFGLHEFHKGQIHNADFYVEELLHFADALGIEKFDLLGTSMGGAIATYFAATHPERVGRLILLSPAGIEPPTKNYFMREVGRGSKPLIIRNEQDFDRVVDMAFDRNPSIPWQFRTWVTERAVRHAAELTAIVDAMQDFLLKGLTKVLGQVRSPTLVIWGDRDMVIDPGILKIFVEGIPNAKGVLINDGGHIVSDDSPEETRKAITPFLDAPSPPLTRP